MFNQAKLSAIKTQTLIFGVVLICVAVIASGCGDTGHDDGVSINPIPTVDLNKSPVFAGSGKITKFYGGPNGGEPCVNDAKITITFDDNAVLLDSMSVDILPPNCSATGDMRQDKVLGNYNPKTKEIVFNKCNFEEITSSTAEFGAAADGSSALIGTVDCYLEGKENLIITYDTRWVK